MSVTHPSANIKIFIKHYHVFLTCRPNCVPVTGFKHTSENTLTISQFLQNQWAYLGSSDYYDRNRQRDHSWFVIKTKMMINMKLITQKDDLDYLVILLTH